MASDAAASRTCQPQASPSPPHHNGSPQRERRRRSGPPSRTERHDRRYAAPSRGGASDENDRTPAELSATLASQPPASGLCTRLIVTIPNQPRSESNMGERPTVANVHRLPRSRNGWNDRAAKSAAELKIDERALTPADSGLVSRTRSCLHRLVDSSADRPRHHSVFEHLHHVTRDSETDASIESHRVELDGIIGFDRGDVAVAIVAVTGALT